MNSNFYKQFSVHLKELFSNTLWILTTCGTQEATEFISLLNFKVMITKLTHLETKTTNFVVLNSLE